MKNINKTPELRVRDYHNQYCLKSSCQVTSAVKVTRTAQHC